MIRRPSARAAAAFASLAAPAVVVPIVQAAPDLPIISNLSFDQAVAQHKTSTALILLVATEQFTAEDWERSVWNQPELTDYLTGRRIPVIYADTTTDAAAVWLLEVDRLPAAIYFGSGIEKGRRYGLDGRDAADTMIRWLQAASRNSSLSQEVRHKIAEEPGDISLRFELIHELNTEGDRAGVTEQICWLLNHNDVFEETASEAEGFSEDLFRRGLLFYIGGMLERVGNRITRDPFAAWPEDRWQQLAASLEWTPLYQRKVDGHLTASLRHTLELQRTLAARVADGTASDRDRFILDALNASKEELSTMLEVLQTSETPDEP